MVELSAGGRKVFFLRYPAFDEDAHPALEYSLNVHLPTATHSFRDYRESANPLILHRKDSLVEPLYPLHQEFCSLTEQEEALGLLSRTNIGFRRQWEAVLSEMGLRIKGHRIAPAGAIQ